MLTGIVIALALLVVLVAAGVWFLKRKLGEMGQHLPDALQQWEKEIEKLEKPKG